MSREPVDLEDFFFFLCENPIPFATSTQYRKPDRTKTQEEINREYENNVRWMKKIQTTLLQRAHITARLIEEHTKKNTAEQKQGGLDKWI